jgi:hypothetical protein
MGTTKVAHLITKIADEKKERERVDITFDYGVPTDEVQPEVRAYCTIYLIVKSIVNPVVGLFSGDAIRFSGQSIINKSLDQAKK